MSKSDTIMTASAIVFFAVVCIIIFFTDSYMSKKYETFPENDAKILSHKTLPGKNYDTYIREICVHGNLFLMAYNTHGLGFIQVFDKQNIPKKCE